MIDSVQRSRALDVDTLPVMSTLTRSALPIVGAAVLAGALGYFVTAGQPKVYEAGSAIFATNSSNSQLGNTMYTAPTLPRGALREALVSPAVILDVVSRVQGSGLPQGQVSSMVSSLKSELTNGNVKSLKLAVVDESSNGGVYSVNGRASTPAAARVLTNAAVDALLAWDAKRAQTRMVKARASLQSQLTALNTETPDNNINASAYQATRQQLLQDLALVGAAASSATGTLDVVSPAIDPSGAAAPRPLRSALLSALLALLTATALALLLASLRPAPSLDTRPERYTGR
ncbi:uncharacterized protein involved in exopolysaccharide biosynthesis [Deinococcus metalli]|uniref:Uncharacterized protein involved in exopolysaccharide biosynthesis n=1 Tax=Deinococcus metalli TaxID=1141878 RepID=A0A7W8KD61_9DEIO|nr:hypothetical protein [Deinococcus metalli]MBB5375941.1 uncharacterized protein involved in exopolysaccharide biosynthesis [Deinococcus metalli]GHF35942.1 hypothetical protein GCM10017781_10630 [Deinococcus metalli]